MRLNWFFRRLAILPAIVLLGAGCSGINASQSVSPLSFFLPGLVQNEPASKDSSPAKISQQKATKDLGKTS